MTYSCKFSSEICLSIVQTLSKKACEPYLKRLIIPLKTQELNAYYFIERNFIQDAECNQALLVKNTRVLDIVVQEIFFFTKYSE